MLRLNTAAASNSRAYSLGPQLVMDTAYATVSIGSDDEGNEDSIGFEVDVVFHRIIVTRAKMIAMISTLRFDALLDA